MVEAIILNWVIFSLEILIGIFVMSHLFTELFGFFELPRVKYKFGNEKSNHLLIRKSGLSLMKQFIQLFIHLSIIVAVYFLTLLYNDIISEDPLILLYTVGLGFAFLLIPKKLFVLFKLLSSWVRQVKYYIILLFLMYPGWILDERTLPDNEFFMQLWTDFDGLVHFFFPTQLLIENGYVFSLIEKQQIFLLIFVGIPIALLFLNHLQARILRRFSRFELFEWDFEDNSWIKLDESAYKSEKDVGVLLVQGIGSTKDMWSSYSDARNSTRVMDFLSLKTNERYLNAKIFSLNFSNKLKNSLKIKYKSSNHESPIHGDYELNNYVFELFYTIYILKMVKEIEILHIVSHSAGGVVVRKMFDEINTNRQLRTYSEVLNSVGYKKDISDDWMLIDRVSWLATPHFGNKGGSAYLVGVKDTLLYKTLGRLLFSILLFTLFFSVFGRILKGLGLDTPGNNDLDPDSNYLSELNGKPPRVKVYGKQEWKNVLAEVDNIVADGSKINQKIERLNQPSGSFEEKEYLVNHSNTPWEQKKHKPEEKSVNLPPIYNSYEVIEWIFASKTEKLTDK